jgi:hypothetical protein
MSLARRQSEMAAEIITEESSVDKFGDNDEDDGTSAISNTLETKQQLRLESTNKVHIALE